jgi:hypothetical protein
MPSVSKLAIDSLIDPNCRSARYDAQNAKLEHRFSTNWNVALPLVSADNFAEILPRFKSQRISHRDHKSIFSDRDPLFYWLYVWYEAGAGSDQAFIIPPSTNR